MMTKPNGTDVAKQINQHTVTVQEHRTKHKAGTQSRKQANKQRLLHICSGSFIAIQQ